MKLEYSVIQLCDFRGKMTRIFEYDELLTTMILLIIRRKERLLYILNVKIFDVSSRESQFFWVRLKLNHYCRDFARDGSVTFQSVFKISS